MGEILFIAHRIPFPPDRGDKIRSHNILKRLAQMAPVHVATFADDAFDLAEEGALAEVAASYRLVHRSKPLALAGVQAIASHAPVSLTAFRHAAIEEYVRKTVQSRSISAIYVFSGQMGQYVPDGFSGRVIADFVDVDSAKFEAYGAKGNSLRSWIDAREGRVLRTEEVRLADRADVSLLISDAEVTLFRDRLPEDARGQIDVRALGNGIDSEGFDPALAEPEARLAEYPAPRLIFTGQMDYAPNIEAAERARSEILPRVRAQCPEASFHVVGRNPPASLLEKSGKDGFHVWGRVPDMRAWLKAADIALVPLTIGRGVQNKVLEAMAMELPAVLSAEAATGICATSGTQFEIADCDDALAAAIVRLATDPEAAKAMGQAARKYVVENASWDAALSTLPAIVGMEGQSVRDAA